MPVFQYRSRLPVSVEENFSWHERPGALERLIQPWQPVRLLEHRGGIRDGDQVALEIHLGGLGWKRWVVRHRDYLEGRQFCDEQVEGPFPFWLHCHRFHPEAPNDSFYEDEIDYRLPGGALGRLVGEGAAARALERVFRHRHERVRRDLARHQQHAGSPPLRIALSGASGLVGRNLAAFLRAGGHRVQPLVRRAPRSEFDEIPWDPERGAIHATPLEGIDAVVHLAGEPIASGLWTKERKRRILESRVSGTRLLSRALAGLVRPPRVFVSASGIHYYGSRGDEVLTEGSPSGSGFLAQVVEEWEAATAPARETQTRVVHLRTGPVLAAGGGMLGPLGTVFRFGLGATMGDGRQYLSWIALDDLIGAIHHLLFAEDVAGPVNATAPEPVTQARFTQTLAEVLRRPAPWRIPSQLLRLGMGEMGRELLLSSGRVLPTRLLQSGFRFQEPELEGGLRSELGLQEG